MAGQITSIEVQARNPKRANVFVEGEFALGLALIEAAKLSTGQYLSDADIERLRERDDAERAHEFALNYLSYRPRSEHEVRQRLAEKGFAAHAIDDAAARLLRTGLVDDQAFARYWVDNRTEFKPRGPAALRRELWQKGVPDAIVDDVVADQDEDENAYRAALQRLTRWQRMQPEERRRKLTGYLQRRGFGYDSIRQAWERLVAEHAIDES
ncbi:MAG: RecX family transcriptional regulator [Anaerolineae bacterium]|nr:RecX family transcriptional regulator [Anaerolineae bacterium]